LAAFYLKRNKPEFERLACEGRDFAAKYNAGFHLQYMRELTYGLAGRFENAGGAPVK
jgi:hypothetical protein